LWVGPILPDIQAGKRKEASAMYSASGRRKKEGGNEETVGGVALGGSSFEEEKIEQENPFARLKGGVWPKIHSGKGEGKRRKRRCLSALEWKEKGGVHADFSSTPRGKNRGRRDCALPQKKKKSRGSRSIIPLK